MIRARRSIEPPPSIDAKRRTAIRRRLLDWYDRNKRDLPWRRRRSPYAQWVAEIMLQQTRVETVQHYYERFMKRFATVRALAGADHTTVLKHWEGLGYYRRVLNLHRAARIVRDQGGRIPRTIEALARLPGVGPYTAAAIASIAFNEPVAAVDGNVARVLARLFAVDLDVRSGPGQRAIQALATELVSHKRPGDFNQALMDLGSMICAPRTPNCPKCPLKSLCEARRLGRVDSLPVREAKGRVKEAKLVTSLFIRGDKMLLRRRPTGGLWSGLWEFPTIEVPQKHIATRTVRDMAGAEGLDVVGRPRKIALVKHKLTHRALQFHIYVCRVIPRPRRGATDLRNVTQEGSNTYTESARWVTRRRFEELPVSTAQRKVFAASEETLGLIAE